MSKTRKIELYEDIYKSKFSFGKNWEKLFRKMDDKKIESAKISLSKFTGLDDFENKSFIDIGCGSGLFSLGAYLLGAKRIASLDVDEHSLFCTEHLREKYNIPKSIWEIRKMSVLDHKGLDCLGKFDIVYSWGVLHHTGKMWDALKNVNMLVKENGLLYISIYNHFKGLPVNSEEWRQIKRIYSKSNKIVRKFMEYVYISFFIIGRIVLRKNPFKYIKNYGRGSGRGMDFFRDVEDWLGGYPYEFASVREISDFYKKMGFNLKNLKEAKREACNEFLFEKQLH